MCGLAPGISGKPGMGIIAPVLRLLMLFVGLSAVKHALRGACPDIALIPVLLRALAQIAFGD